MKKIILAFLTVFILSCKEKKPAMTLSAQQIVDKSITVCGGDLFETHTISFDFRKRTYTSEKMEGLKVLRRLLKNDTIHLLDIKSPKGFLRYKNDSLIILTDSLSSIYANAVNSVHYFAQLPYGLNDPAVHKELLGEIDIKGATYYKVKVTFDQEGGGDDFDDTYLYWFNKTTLKPDYLGYEFHVNGGGMRFRQAYNERYVNGIRFVDYMNLKPKDFTAKILKIDSLFINDELELLSKIELKAIHVRQGNYN
jgi:hypothetical protein